MQALMIPPEIAVGHSSHILIDRTGAGQRGVLTRSLLKSLKEPSALGDMTYKGLVDAINGKMEKLVPLVTFKSDVSREERADVPSYSPEQKAICTCTSIYQNRRLFNGLFSRSVSEDGVRPVITVKYLDL